MDADSVSENRCSSFRKFRRDWAKWGSTNKRLRSFRHSKTFHMVIQTRYDQTNSKTRDETLGNLVVFVFRRFELDLSENCKLPKICVFFLSSSSSPPIVVPAKRLTVAAPKDGSDCAKNVFPISSFPHCGPKDSYQTEEVKRPKGWIRVSLLFSSDES